MKARIIVMIDYEVDDDNYPENTTTHDKAQLDLKALQIDHDFAYDQLFNSSTEPLISVIPLD